MPSAMPVNPTMSANRTATFCDRAEWFVRLGQRVHHVRREIAREVGALARRRHLGAYESTRATYGHRQDAGDDENQDDLLDASQDVDEVRMQVDVEKELRIVGLRMELDVQRSPRLGQT